MRKIDQIITEIETLQMNMENSKECSSRTCCKAEVGKPFLGVLLDLCTTVRVTIA
jgi:hypothetical protein